MGAVTGEGILPETQSQELDGWREGLGGQMETAQHTFLSAFMHAMIAFEFLELQI